MCDTDFQLLEHLYKELKLHGIDNRNDISNIVQQGEKLKNLDEDLDEIADMMGRLSFTKMRLEKDVNELVKRIDHYDSVMGEKYQNGWGKKTINLAKSKRLYWIRICHGTKLGLIAKI